MKPGWLAEHAFAEFRRRRSQLESVVGQNEAATRLKVIDTVLFEILRWDKAVVETELHSRKIGYADYVFGVESSFSLVLEAKRQGTTFVISERVHSSRPLPFALLARESPGAADALRQACSYAVQFGAQYIAVSNGHQWILALTFVQGTPIESRSVIVFASIDQIADNFRDFWGAFSPLAIKTNRPTQDLLDSCFDLAPPKLSARINNYPQPASRNIFRNELSTIIEPMWAKATQDDSDIGFLKACYVKPLSETDDLDVAKMLLRRAQPREDAEEVTVAAAARNVSSLIYDTARAAHKPVALLGRVGFGKSIFLHYLRNIYAAEELSKYIQIVINFVDRPDTPDDVPGFIYSEIDRQLLELHSIDVRSDALARSVLNFELERFRSSTRAKLYADDAEKLANAEVVFLEGLQQDRHSYYGNVFRHLIKGQKRCVAVFFDNLDRQSDSIQESAFLRASAIARDWLAVVFICLRPGTFQRSRSAGVLDTVAPQVLTIAPPPTSVMLKRRFEYAQKVAETAEDFSAHSGAEEQSPLDYKAARDFFQVCAQSFGRNQSLGEIFTCVSNGNVRAILHYVRDVMRSGHLDTEKILEKVEATRKYDIAAHEALRALLYGDYKHFCPSSSPFINLFDIQHSEPREHFTRLLALEFFGQHVTAGGSSGYCQVEDAQAYLYSLGYSGSHVQWTLRILYEGKCLEGTTYDALFDESGEELRITALGRYHCNDLVGTFVYVDAISVDTPIIDERRRREIKDVSEIGDRILRARSMLGYLEKCANSLGQANARRAWERVYLSVDEELVTIQDIVESTK